jgi:hypothetical protein
VAQGCPLRNFAPYNITNVYRPLAAEVVAVALTLQKALSFSAVEVAAVV